MSSFLDLAASFDVASDNLKPLVWHEAACSCGACAGTAERAGDGAEGLTAAKPVFSLSQIVGALTRSDSAWPAGAVVAYSFRNAPAPEGSVGFSPLSEVERSFARQAFEAMSDVANLRFVELPDDGRSTQDGDRIYFARDDDAPDHEWGRASRWFINTPQGKQITASEVFLSTDAVAQRSWFVGGYNFHAMMHEVGHALGLSHPGAYNANGEVITYAGSAGYAQDSRQYSMMSYFSASNTGADHVVDSKGGSYSSGTPLLHDIAALQSLYGANTGVRTGDTVYGFNSTAGRAAYDFTQNPTPIFTIWDGGGVDTLDLSQANQRVSVELTAGRFSDALEMTNNISIAFGVTVENGRGGRGDDFFAGNSVGNRLEGGDGNDDLGGREGDDLLFGDGGDDVLWGDAGRDALFGGEGDDRIRGGAESDFLAGENGRDTLHGDDGDDDIGGRDGDDVLFGDFGADVLWGDAGRDALLGGVGDDRLHGGAEADFLAGEDGRDTLHGDDGDDDVGGREGDDVLLGDLGDDVLWGDAGRDALLGGVGDDRLHGGAESDFLAGEDGRDTLHGGDGDDDIGGRDGDDVLFGESGNDVLWGDVGADRLTGGGGADRLAGGAGADVFVFLSGDSSPGGMDWITDFNGWEDRFDLSGIDANRLTAQDEPFRFVGGFSRQAGEAVLSYDAAANRSTLRLDTDGDGAADMAMSLTGAHSPELGWVL